MSEDDHVIRFESEEKELIEPIEHAEAMVFLQSQLKNVQAKIRKQEDYLERYAPDSKKTSRGARELIQVFQQEKTLVEELMVESQEILLVEVFRQHLNTLQRRMAYSNIDQRTSKS